ncbi:MAG: imidazolonepropionase [Gemmatimonadales bacterium]
MDADLLVTNIRQLATPTGTGASRGHAMDAVDVLYNMAMVVAGERIVWMGPQTDVAALPGSATIEIDAHGHAVIPALVDPHTHGIWRGDRLEDFDARSRGASYQEILSRGGGIWNTIRATMDAPGRSDEQWLATLAEERIRHLIRSGAATIEMKSGYGFIKEGEIRSLEAIRIVAEQSLATIIPTLLIHVPPIDPGDRDDYLVMVTDDLIPEVAKRKLAEAVDVFIEEDAFSADEAVRIFTAARNAGLRVKAHADQFAVIGGVEAALEFNALSVDHLEATMDDDEIAAIAASDTVAVLLPGASLHLGMPSAPGRDLIDAGAAVAVGTDLNPGSSPLFSTQLAMALAVRMNDLTVSEALTAATANAAAALGLTDRGRLRVGQRADFIVTEYADWRDAVYQMGANPVQELFIGGRETEFP